MASRSTYGRSCDHVHLSDKGSVVASAQRSVLGTAPDAGGRQAMRCLARLRRLLVNTADEHRSLDDRARGTAIEPAIPDGAGARDPARYSDARQVAARKPESSPRWR